MAINANELRIGNWVYPNEENATPYQVKGILNDEKIYFGLGGFNSRVEILASELDPIPLTPEMLVACGFVEDGVFADANWYNKIALIRTNNNGICAFELSLFQTQYDDWGFNLEEQYLGYCKHLHQLQNIYFALTGTELVYKPKIDKDGN